MIKILLNAVTMLLMAVFATAAKAENSSPEHVVWNVSLWGKERAFTEHIEKLAQLVEEESANSFKLNLVYESVLSKDYMNLDGISNGNFEMAQICIGNHIGNLHAIQILELPFLGVSNIQEAASLSERVYRDYLVEKELGEYNAVLLMPSPLPQYNPVGVGNPPKTVNDFNHLYIRIWGKVGVAVEAIGSTSVVTPLRTLNKALDKGLIDAVSLAPHSHLEIGTLNHADWLITNLNPGTIDCPVVVSASALDRLSPNNCGILWRSSRTALEHYIDNYQTHIIEGAWQNVVSDRKIEQVTLDGSFDTIKERTRIAAIDAWSKSGRDKYEKIELDNLYRRVFDRDPGELQRTTQTTTNPLPCAGASTTLLEQ